jgi:hypothetical protein
MLTIIWNAHGFYVVDKLPNDAKMNNDYFVTKILSLFEKAIFTRGRAAHQKRFTVHVDNCSVHISRASTSWREEHSMRHMPHQLYLLDLTSRDLYLFLTVKETLERIQVRQEDLLFESLQEILEGINHDQLNRVFRA